MICFQKTFYQKYKSVIIILGLVLVTQSKDDFDIYLNKQLEKLQTDHIDFYLLHTLDRKKWVNLRQHKVIDWAEKAINDGQISHIGFSFHDDLDTFKEIVDYHDWTFCQILYNYVDSEREAGVEGLRYAASKGLAVNVMQPNQAGLLSIPPLPEVQAIWDESPIKRSPTGWAMNWVWNQPEVSTVLSGMSSMAQVVENIGYASNSGVNKLTSDELKLIERVRNKYLEVGLVGCTECMHCQVCPEGILIPEIFKIFNEYYASDKFMRDSAQPDDPSKKKYWQNIPESQQAGECTKCGLCEMVCPQQLPIIKLLKNISWKFKK